MKKIPIEISARHIHLSQKDLEFLFGKEYQLKKLRDITQNQFAAKEILDIQAGSEKIKNVRIVGPVRPETQVEISVTDSFKLGIKVPIKKSGEIKGTPGIVLIGPKKKVKIKRGVIIALRHLHCGLEEAKKLNLKNNQIISVKVKGKRALTFHNVKVRTGKNYRLCLHLDTDEGNSAGISKKGKGYLET